MVSLVHYTSYCTFDKLIKVAVIWLYKGSKFFPLIQKINFKENYEKTIYVTTFLTKVS